MNLQGVPTVDADEARDELEAGAYLLDVRRPEEFEEARIAGAQLITLQELSRRVEELPEGRRLVVYCKSGGRSGQAVSWLNARGFDAVNMAGGIDDWQLRGLPTETGPADQDG